MAPGSSVKIAIIGAGSIGSRHAQILRDSRHEVVVVSRQAGAGKYEKISVALKHEKFEYVVVASKTSQHLDDLRQLSASKFSGTVLIEKPILTNFKSFQEIISNLRQLATTYAFILPSHGCAIHCHNSDTSHLRICILGNICPLGAKTINIKTQVRQLPQAGAECCETSAMN